MVPWQLKLLDTCFLPYENHIHVHVYMFRGISSVSVSDKTCELPSGIYTYTITCFFVQIGRRTNIVQQCRRYSRGVTKVPFVNFPVSKIFDLAKVPLRLFESRSYLTGATAAELRRHLSNINMMFNSLKRVFTKLNISENNGTEEIGLVTPNSQIPDYRRESFMAECVKGEIIVREYHWMKVFCCGRAFTRHFLWMLSNNNSTMVSMKPQLPPNTHQHFAYASIQSSVTCICTMWPCIFRHSWYAMIDCRFHGVK